MALARIPPLAVIAAAAAGAGGLLSLAWVPFEVGALSYGGGFVIVPLMQADAVNHYHWMTSGQFPKMMIAWCIPILVIAVTLVVTGVVGAGLIFGAIMCTVMMAMMMALMSGASEK